MTGKIEDFYLLLTTGQSGHARILIPNLGQKRNVLGNVTVHLSNPENCGFDTNLSFLTFGFSFLLAPRG